MADSLNDLARHALRDDIEDVVTRHYPSATGHGMNPAEGRVWKHSLLKMAKILGDDEIPDDANVAIEYQLPQSARCNDFVITGDVSVANDTREHVRCGDRKGALYAIENGRVRPSKMLMDSGIGLLQGKPEFVPSDDRKVVHESILQVAAQHKQVVIVQGRPGTGRSVAAANLRGALLGRGCDARAYQGRRRPGPCTSPSWLEPSRRHASATCSAIWVSRQGRSAEKHWDGDADRGVEQPVLLLPSLKRHLLLGWITDPLPVAGHSYPGPAI